MPDIQLRLNKDVLVFSTTFDRTLNSEGFTEKGDREYVALCEPELIEEAYRFESIIGTPCLVTATEGITRARLSYARFEDQAEEMAQIAYDTAAQYTPQHIIATIGPTGLPLDETSAPSLKQSRKQYQDAVQILTAHPFDAIYFSGFTNPYDAQCALTGARAVYDGVVMISFKLDAEGNLCGSKESLADAIERAAENGADVIGISTPAPVEKLKNIIELMRSKTDKALLVELRVGKKDPRQLNPTDENPYNVPDRMVEAGIMLRSWGVQFLRAAGKASPSYTGALVAATTGLDVVN